MSCFRQRFEYIVCNCKWIFPCAFNVGNFYKDTEALNLTLVANEMAKKLSKKFVFRTIGLNVLKLANLAIICGRGSFIDLKNNGKWQTIELEKTNKETYYDREIGLVFYYFSQLTRTALFLYFFIYVFMYFFFLLYNRVPCMVPRDVRRVGTLR